MKGKKLRHKLPVRWPRTTIVLRNSLPEIVSELERKRATFEVIIYIAGEIPQLVASDQERGDLGVDLFYGESPVSMGTFAVESQ